MARSTSFLQEPEVDRRKVKWRSAAKGKPEVSQYLPESTKTGDFKPQRTFYEKFFVIPERLASIRSVDLAFIANKQTNKQLYKDIYLYFDCFLRSTTATEDTIV